MAGSAYDIARGQLGKTAPLIADYLKTGGVNLNPQQLAWCAAFVNSSLAQAGVKGSGSNLARSFLNVGEETKEPQRGDLAVFWRGDRNGPLGHVGFYDGATPDGRIKILGGDQSDAVTYTTMNPSKLLGYRRVGGAAPSGAFGDVVGPAAPGGSPTPSMVGQPTPQFGDVLGPTGEPNMANPGVAAAQNVLATEAPKPFLDMTTRKKQEEDETQKRRQALFGGGLSGLYA
ncbi:TIGR02594 family protein [Bosea lathyri]|uniref:TIGR02594 family protein n=1 Tax=Bosea lathyri TaxID=1036778 RepID=A0A1H6BWJ7_9HYPH|nr:TIGR02594 family protein [Bosea lathyri]SEG65078.1 TIGR02594 family protein [Bosea lathyri]